jgi:hypothetical protein
MGKLTTGNNYVWKHFIKASDSNKQRMYQVLKEQTKNLHILLELMEKELDVVAMEPNPEPRGMGFVSSIESDKE